MQNLKSFSRSPLIYNSFAASFATNSATAKKSKSGLFSRAPPLPNLREYYDLRIYRQASWSSLLCTLAVNTLSRRRFLAVRNNGTYDFLTIILGRKNADNLYFSTFGNLYLSGGSLDSVRRELVNYNDKNISVQVSYRLGQGADRTDADYELEENLFRYLQSLDVIGTNYRDNAISIDLTGLGSYEVLSKVSKGQAWIQNVFESFSGKNQDKQTADVLYEKLKQKYIECDESEFAEFLTAVLNRDVSSNLSSEEITKFEWLQNVHAFYIDSPEKNSQKILRQINRLTDEEVSRMESFCGRLQRIYEKAKTAEIYGICNEVGESQLQPLSDTITQQFSVEFNKDRVLLLNTVPNTEAGLGNKIQFELARSQFLRNPVGLKLVGSDFAGISKSTANGFNENVEKVVKDAPKGSKIIVATSDPESIESVKRAIDKKGSRQASEVRLGQRRGVGEYLTQKLNREGYKVIEEVYYGPRSKVTPWLLQRVQETYENPVASRIENKLVVNEIKRRLRLI